MAVVRPDDRGFFEACLARPADALPRLIWADYLDDTFRSKAAEYMRGERATALLTAAAERVQAGSDADRITRIVLWMARGGHLADAIDHAAASEDAVQTMRLALRLVDGGQ